MNFWPCKRTLLERAVQRNFELGTEEKGDVGNSLKSILAKFRCDPSSVHGGSGLSKFGRENAIYQTSCINWLWDKHLPARLSVARREELLLYFGVLFKSTLCSSSMLCSSLCLSPHWVNQITICSSSTLRSSLCSSPHLVKQTTSQICYDANNFQGSLLFSKLLCALDCFVNQTTWFRIS